MSALEGVVVDTPGAAVVVATDDVGALVVVEALVVVALVLVEPPGAEVVGSIALTSSVVFVWEYFETTVPAAPACIATSAQFVNFSPEQEAFGQSFPQEVRADLAKPQVAPLKVNEKLDIRGSIVPIVL